MMKNKIYRLELDGELVFQPDDLDGSYPAANILPEELTTPAIIVIDGLDINDDHITQKALDAVYQLRRSAMFYAMPIFFAKSMGSLDAFVDGIASTRKDISTRSDDIISRLESISLATNASNDDLRLLTFLFCRGDSFSLSPLVFASSPWIYEYPVAFLIGAFAGKTMQSVFRVGPFAGSTQFSQTTMQSSAEWLVSLCTQGLLATKELVDRIRICPHCHTGKLNYIDTCPICGSIDFSKKKMIHCFTCGHVAPEKNFENGMMLICPRCNVTLRHIGSDYDRPVESYICNSCGERFIEPDVQADCLKCRNKSATEDLVVRQLYHYGITPKGKRAVQLGAVDLEFSLFDNNRNVVPLYFYQVTDWLLQMKARYSDEEFALLCIKITGLEAIKSMAGMARFTNLIDELAMRIRELVRSTDITTSTGTNCFWVLLPRTNQKGGETLASRIAKLADMVALENGAKIHIHVKCFTIPTEYACKGPVAEMLIREYEAALEDVR